MSTSPSPSSSSQHPARFFCPITQDLMRDPVFTVDGQVYDYEAIRAWFDAGHKTSPNTRLELCSLALVPVYSLREEMTEADLGARLVTPSKATPCAPARPRAPTAAATVETNPAGLREAPASPAPAHILEAELYAEVRVRVNRVLHDFHTVSRLLWAQDNNLHENHIQAICRKLGANGAEPVPESCFAPLNAIFVAFHGDAMVVATRASGDSTVREHSVAFGRRATLFNIIESIQVRGMLADTDFSGRVPEVKLLCHWGLPCRPVPANCSVQAYGVPFNRQLIGHCVMSGRYVPAATSHSNVSQPSRENLDVALTYLMLAAF